MSVSAAEMLAALVGQPVPLDVDGLGTVRVRGLTLLEYERILAEVGESEVQTLLNTVAAGLVEPALTSEELAQAGMQSVAVLRPIFDRILTLSALNPETEKAVASFGGGGS